MKFKETIKYMNKEMIDSYYFELSKRNQDDVKEINEIVEDIYIKIATLGNEALFEYCERFDNVSLNEKTIRITKEEINKAYSKVDSSLVEVIKKSKENITMFHKNQIENPYMMKLDNETELGQLVRPMDTVGIYVPGGTAPLPSTVLMNTIPAKIAGVEKIIMVTPPKKEGVNPAILVAANEAGVDEIYQVGGAQAIIALALGTTSIPKVDKIVGPGNIFVAMAKKRVFGLCDIDMIAGPSEILIVADENANPRYVAADMLSQAEHDTRAASILVTTSNKLIPDVQKEIEEQLKLLSRNQIAKKSIEDNAVFIKVDSIKEASLITNQIAPEHLELMFDGADKSYDMFKHAGAIFIGNYSPEPLGDYFAGSNHVLPTSGSAKFSSPLGVYDFVKRTQVIKYSKSRFEKVRDDVVTFAESEGLDAHANAIKIRD